MMSEQYFCRDVSLLGDLLADLMGDLMGDLLDDLSGDILDIYRFRCNICNEFNRQTNSYF